MKKGILLLLGIAGLVLAGCSVQQQFGSVQITIPAAMSRDITTADTIRLSLFRYGTALPIDGAKTVIEQQVQSDDVIQLNRLAAGPGYVLSMSLGSKSESGLFKVAKFARSETFSVTSDMTAQIQMRIKSSPFTWVSEADKNMIASAGGIPWVLSDGKKLYRLDQDQPQLVVEDVSLDLAGYQINSLGAGLAFANQADTLENSFKPELWLNTDKGIVPYVNGRFVTDFMPIGMNPNVKFSRAFTIKPTEQSKTMLLVFFAGSGTTIGGSGTADSQLSSAQWPWLNLDSLINDMGDIKKMLAGGNDVLRSVSFGNGFCYLATSINTLRIDGPLVASFPVKASTADMTSWLTSKLLNDPNTIIKIPNESIYQIDTSGSFLYAGTLRGLYVAPIDAIGKPTTALAKVGMATDRITAIATFMVPGADGAEYAAAVSASGKLLVLKNGALVTEVDAMAGMPGGNVSLAWYKGDVPYLLIAGDGAVVKMAVR